MTVMNQKPWLEDFLPQIWSNLGSPSLLQPKFSSPIQNQIESCCEEYLPHVVTNEAAKLSKPNYLLVQLLILITNLKKKKKEPHNAIFTDL